MVRKDKIIASAVFKIVIECAVGCLWKKEREHETMSLPGGNIEEVSDERGLEGKRLSKHNYVRNKHGGTCGGRRRDLTDRKGRARNIVEVLEEKGGRNRKGAAHSQNQFKGERSTRRAQKIKEGRGKRVPFLGEMTGGGVGG